MKFEYQDKIDRYVQNEMSKNERKSFENEISENEELRDQLLFTQKVKSLMSSRAEKLNKMKQWQDEDDLKSMCSVPVSSHKHQKRLWYWTSGVAAVLLIGLFVVNPRMLKRIFYQYDPNPMIIYPKEIYRGDDEKFDSGVEFIDSCARNLPMNCDSIEADTIRIHKDEK